MHHGPSNAAVGADDDSRRNTTVMTPVPEVMITTGLTSNPCEDWLWEISFRHCIVQVRLSRRFQREMPSKIHAMDFLLANSHEFKR
jgi:hypothetical protein